MATFFGWAVLNINQNFLANQNLEFNSAMVYVLLEFISKKVSIKYSAVMH